ncbi:type III PLP-dependent enzyme [Pseudonocardia sp. CA-107938]|uniref:type III PLP-dependent enzyme n=1 Tax=Pseudonocardia sp. CA-107938 TaxID=3240021 RepID=UPI003D9045C5
MVLPSAAVDRFLSTTDAPTPFLVLDPEVVAQRYREFVAVFPGAAIHYAVKACPHPAVLRVLAEAGASFDVASPAEVRLVLEAGAPPSTLCYGNPIRAARDVATAHAAGVRRFVTDSVEDLEVLGVEAPGAGVLVRILVSDAGSATPFASKFGVTCTEAVRLLQHAAAVGLRADGVAFHAGSQQSRPAAFADAVRQALAVAAAAQLRRPVLNIGGGFPIAYREPVPAIAEFAEAVRGAIGPDGIDLVVEPGRALVGEAGVLRASVVRVSHRPGIDHRRWVYLDIGRYAGLAETEGEAIAYALRTPGRGGPGGPVVIAGPTCDGDDVLYRRTPYELPLDLRSGDVVDLLGAGAYTASYASVGFNGFPPPAVYVAGQAPG